MCWPSVVPMANPCSFSRILKLTLAGVGVGRHKKQVHPRHQSNGLDLSSPGGLIKGGHLDNVFVIGLLLILI